MKKTVFVMALVVLTMSGLAFHADAVPMNDGSGQMQKAANFSAVDMQGTKVSLDTYLGKDPVLLVFFATWCPPCRREVPELVKLQNTYADKGLEIIAVSLDNARRVLPRFIKQQKINYTVWHDEMNEGRRAYNVSGIPMNLLINKSGEVTYLGHQPPSAGEIKAVLE